jgi:hypothetical protein
MAHMEIKVKITVPREKKGWQMTIGHGGVMRRSSATYLYALLERKIKSSLASRATPTLAVSVNYGHGCANEGKYSNFWDFMYAVTSFLEDYLERRFMIRRLTHYGDFIWVNSEKKYKALEKLYQEGKVVRTKMGYQYPEKARPESLVES